MSHKVIINQKGRMQQRKTEWREGRDRNFHFFLHRKKLIQCIFIMDHSHKIKRVIAYKK